MFARLIKAFLCVTTLISYSSCSTTSTNMREAPSNAEDNPVPPAVVKQVEGYPNLSNKSHFPAIDEFFLCHAERMNEETKSYASKTIYAFMWSFSIVCNSAIPSPKMVGFCGKYPSLEFLQGLWRYILECGPTSFQQNRAERKQKGHNTYDIYRPIISYVGKTKDKEAVPVLIDNLRRSSNYVREYAEALAEIGTQKAVDGLKELVSDDTMPKKTRDTRDTPDTASCSGRATSSHTSSAAAKPTWARSSSITSGRS